jgi:iron complex transport system permease protein
MATLLVSAIIVSLNVGYTPIPFSKVSQIILKNVPLLGDFVELPPDISDTEIGVVLDIRLPRTVGAALVGAALAVAGLIYQRIFKNQMADPLVIGASSGAALFGAIAILLGLGLSAFGLIVPLLAFFGCLLSLFLVYSISRVGSKVPTATLLLIGLLLNMLFSVVFSYIQTGGNVNVLYILTWLTGSFSNVPWLALTSALPFFFVGIGAIFAYSGALNKLALSENETVKSGVPLGKTRLILLVFTALLTAAAVSISGIIGFVGLLIPHLAKRLVGVDYRVLLPSSALLGATFLIACDCLGRAVALPNEGIAAGLITITLGVPFFIYLLYRKRKDWLPTCEKEHE